MSLSGSKAQAVFLYACTFIGMGVGILVSVLNTHFLVPEEYGDVRYVINLINFFSGILLVGYFVSGSRLLALASSREEARRIKGGMMVILLVLVAIMSLLMVACGCYHWYIGKGCYTLFFWVIPFSANFILLNYVNTTSQGDNSIVTIGLARLLPSLCYLALAYCVFSFYGASSRLMLLLQSGVSMAIIATLIIRNGMSFVGIRETLHRINEENRQYGRQVYYGSLANISVQYVAGISLGLMGTDNAMVGFYTLALNVSAPLQMLPSIIGTTYFKHFARQNHIQTSVIRSTFLLSAVSYVGFTLLIFPVVAFMYDERYACVATYAVWLAFGSTFQGLGDVFNRFLGAHGLGRMLRNGAFLSGAIGIVGYTLGVVCFGIEGAIFTRIASSCVYFLSMLLYYFYFTREHTRAERISK